MNDCNKCIWSRRDGGCNAWNCEFIGQKEAAKVFKDKRKTGRWTMQNDKSQKRYGWHICSECGAFIGVPSNFCSECGADMRGEKDETN